MATPESETTRHFSEFVPASVAVPSINEVFADPEVLAKKDILSVLREAKKFLTTEKGPNLRRRQELAPLWFDAWHNILGDSPTYNRFSRYYTDPSNHRLMPFEKLAQSIKIVSTQLPVGIITGAGFEGHLAHQKAIDYMSETTFPVMLLEPDSNFRLFDKKRVLPFLPLSIRLLMWNYYPNVGFVSLVPSMSSEEAVDMNHFYQRLIDSVNVPTRVRCFAHETDPNVEAKIRRAHYSPQNIIRGQKLDTTNMVGALLSTSDLSTTDMTQGIMPEIDPGANIDDVLEEWLELIALDFNATMWER